MPPYIIYRPSISKSKYHQLSSSPRGQSLAMASIIPGLRRAAPRLSKDFFICHQCMKHRPAITPKLQLQLPIKSNLTRTIRFNSSTTAIHESRRGFSSKISNKYVSKIQNDHEKQQQQQPHSADPEAEPKAESKAEFKATESFFPSTSSNTVAYWLLVSAGSVFGIVVFGGLTRLTESGYSLLNSNHSLQC